MIQDKLGSPNLITKIVSWLTGTVIGPVISFFKKNGFNIAIAILGFVFLFKIGEAFLGRMSVIFYKEIGFTKSDIALYSKGLGWVTTVIFTLLGGLFAIRSGVIKAMFVSGILMASTNLLFSLLAWSGKSELLFAIAVIFDDMAAAFATVAFVAFISMLVDRTYTATVCSPFLDWNSRTNDFSSIVWGFSRLVKRRLGNIFYYYSNNGYTVLNISLYD